MAIGCNNADRPPIVDPGECVEGGPCPRPGGGPASGASGGTGGAGGSSGSGGGGAVGGTGGTGGSGGSGATGGFGGGSSITGQVTYYDNDAFLLPKLLPLSASATLTARSPEGVYDRTTAWNGVSYTLLDVSVPSSVAIEPADAAFMNAFSLAAEAGVNELTTVRTTVLVDVLALMVFGTQILELDPLKAQVIFRFSSATAGQASGVTVVPDTDFEGLAYPQQGVWVPSPTATSTDESGLAYVVNVDALELDLPLGTGDIADFTYIKDAVPLTVRVRVAQDTVTFVEISLDDR